MRKSTQQIIDEGNARAKALNAQSGYSGTNYMLTDYDPVTGTQKAVSDPLRKEHDIASWDAPTEAGATKWSSQYPGSAFYGPTAGGSWQEINEGMLSDPAVAGAVYKGAAPGSPSSGAFSLLKQKIPADVMQGVSGSSYSLAPEVINKMWR